MSTHCVEQLGRGLRKHYWTQVKCVCSPVSKTVPREPCPLVFMPRCSPLHTAYQGWALKPTEFIRSDGCHFWGLMDSSLASLDHLIWGSQVISSDILRPLGQPSGEVHVARNCGLLPTALWVTCLPAPMSLHTTASLVNSLTPALWETLIQNQPAKLLPNSNPEKLCEIINVCYFKPLNFTQQ